MPDWSPLEDVVGEPTHLEPQIFTPRISVSHIPRLLRQDSRFMRRDLHHQYTTSSPLISAPFPYFWVTRKPFLTLPFAFPTPALHCFPFPQANNSIPANCGTYYLNSINYAVQERERNAFPQIKHFQMPSSKSLVKLI